MPYNPNKQFYQDPVAVGTLAPIVKTAAATENLTAFQFYEAQTVAAQLGVHEFLQTAMAGANNDFDFIARQAGVNSPAVRIAFIVAGASTPASCTVAGGDITVNVATNGASAAISTAAQIKALIEATPAATALVVANLQNGNDGTGVVAAFAITALVAPAATTVDCKLQVSFDGVTYTDSALVFTQKVNAAGAESKSQTAVPVWGRWVLTIGGVTHIAAVSITAVYKP